MDFYQILATPYIKSSSDDVKYNRYQLMFLILSFLDLYSNFLNFYFLSFDFYLLNN